MSASLRIVCLAVLTVVGCADATSSPAIDVADWTLRSDAVHLPADLTPRLGNHAGRYELATDLRVPAELRGRPLVLTVSYLPALATLLVDGSPAMELDRLAWDTRRGSGPHAWRVDPQGERPVHLVLRVDPASTLGLRLDTTPRLSASAAGDRAYVAVRTFNLVTGLMSMGGLAVLMFLYAASFSTDPSQRAHAWFLGHLASGFLLSLWFTGPAQLVFAGFEVSLVHAAFFFSIWFQYGFICEHFGVAFPRRFLAGFATLSVLVMLALHDPFAAARFAIPIQLGLGLVVLVHLGRTLVGIIRQPPQRGDARLLLVAWIAIMALGTPDMLGATGFGRVLGGVQLVPLNILVYGFLVATLLMRDRAYHLRRATQLNAELKRQISERSRELSEAIAAVASPDPLVELQVGSLVAGRYRIVAPLGRGGIGMVFEVERVGDGARLALKVLLRNHPESQARLAREAQIAADLHHPNIVSVVDVGVASGVGIFVVMEIVRGQSLEGCRARFGDQAWALPILRQVLRGLAALHGGGVVHRDLKPSNVLLDGARAPQVKLTDFGIAALLGTSLTGMEETLTDSDRLTRVGAILGTPRYMAPEQVDSSGVTVAADVFSFGVLAAEVLSGVYPFDEPPARTRAHHKEAAGAHLPDLSEPLTQLLRACLAPAPGDRPSAADVLARLEAAAKAA